MRNRPSRCSESPAVLVANGFPPATAGFLSVGDAKGDQIDRRLSQRGFIAIHRYRVEPCLARWAVFWFPLTAFPPGVDWAFFAHSEIDEM
jgi:hypothetical protein